MYPDSLAQGVFFILCILALVPIVLSAVFVLYTHWKLLHLVAVCVIVGVLSAWNPAIANAAVAVGLIYAVVLTIIWNKGNYNEPK